MYQFQKAFEKMNAMSRRLKYAQGRKENISQVKTAKKKKKTLWPLFMDGVQLPQGGSLLFTIQFPEIPGTHFIDLGRMKG